MSLYVGPRNLTTGQVSEDAHRADHTGALVVSPFGGLYDSSLFGRIFHGTTAATGVAPGTAIGTTAAFSLYNPAGNDVDLVVLMARLGYVSGTLGAGFVAWVANTNPAAAAVTGTAITAVNAKLGGGLAAKGKPLTTATLPAAPTLTRVAFNLQASLASTAVAPWVAEDNVDGAIVISPGCTISLEATAAAGTSPLVVYSVTWAEVPTRSGV